MRMLTIRYITGRKSCWLLAVGCWLLAACSSDSTGESGGKTGSTLRIATYTTAYEETDLQMRAVSAGFTEYVPSSEMRIGLFVIPDENPPTEAFMTANPFIFTNGYWDSHVTMEANKGYTIYGYMSKSAPTSATIAKDGAVATMTVTGISAVTADDICFVTGVKDGAKNDSGDLYQGRFNYTGKADNNYVCLLMDHLFASVKFTFAVDDTYAALRTIKLKKLELNTTVASVNATIALTANATDTDPLTSVTYTQVAGTAATAEFFNSTEGLPLSKKSEGKTVISDFCCFAPILNNELTLKTTYDVYDRHNNLIRKDCVATNKLPHVNTGRGQSVTLNLTINPTYLYQLSEPDLDNPTIKFE